ncbi:hypothetical protein ACJIZ3_022731 [Penstemon smallii]|uniref:Nuclear pore complex protein NUP1-like n=1 Tax=Penstemon smallii TaxID=265156 RepID=A0ABD3TN42_9LAMI
MATAEEGGATATTITNSTYGGGGVGGKFRKKPFRKQTTPYDRPSTSLRANNNENNNSWLTKLVVDPASKLISYGANRFFASVFRRRLTSPQPPQPLPPPVQAEVNHEVDEGHQGATSNNQYGAKESTGGECSQPINGSSSNRISELEQLLKQKTFTRSEIDHLTDLLRSRAMEVSLGDECRKNEEVGSDFGTHPQIGSGPVDENRNERIRSHGVHEDDIASPAELAKAYMGSRPLKVSPSTLGMHIQVGREDTGLLNSTPFAPKSPIMAMTTKTSVSLGAPENGFITPRSRGRSAIYNMARTPYSRFHPTSTVKGSGVDNNVLSRPSMSPSSLSLVERDDKFESKSMTLKRRSSALDDDVGSVGPIRRIRPKPNLLAPRIPQGSHGVRIGSAKQKFPLIGDTNHMLSRTVGENENNSTPSTSYAGVPSKSSEVAARILQHLENLTPKEKSPESKFKAAQEKSPFKLTPGMLRGQALRSMESSKALMDVQDDHKLEYRSNPTLPDARDSTSRKDGRVEENGPIPSSMWNPVQNNNSAASLKASGTGTGTSDSVVLTGASQPPHKKRAFRMSALEDSFEQDDLHCNGIEPRPFSERSRPMEVPFKDSNPPGEDPKFVKTTVQPEVKSPPGLVIRQTGELGDPSSVKVGEGSSRIAFPASEEPSAAPHSAVLPQSGATFDKPKEARNPPPLFSFSSKVADKFQPLASESSSRAPESKLEISSSLVNISAPTGSQSVIPESNKSDLLNPLKAAEGIGKSDAAASNGPLFPKPPSMSFTAASSNDTDQITNGDAFLFTPSTSAPNAASTGTGTSTSATSTGSIFGSAVVPTNFAAPIAKLSAPIDSQPKAEINQSSGNTSSSHPTIAASSGSSIFGFTSSTSSSTGNNLQGSLFGSASKSFGSGDGTGSQGVSVQSVSSASLPSFGINNSSSFGSAFSNSQVFNPSSTFGFSSAASSSDAIAVVATTEPTSNLPQFGASSTVVSESTAVSSSSNASPGIFGFGLNSSTNAAAAVGSSNGSNPNPSLFSFAASSSPVTAPVTNTSSSFSSSSAGIFNFSAITSPSSSAMNSNSSSNSSSTTAPSNVFGTSWQSPTTSSIFGSTFTSSSGPSPSTGFLFATSSSTSSAPTNAAPSIFSSSTGASSSPVFSFTSPSASALSTPPQSVFGFAASSPGNNDQMNAEDSMAEDPVQSSAAAAFGQPPISRSSSSVSVFGQQPAVSPSPPGFMFGQTVQPQANPFQFGGQQNQAAPLASTPNPNPNPFQASSSLEFNSGGSFSLGSGGDKSGRRIVRINKNRNRKK